MSAAMAIARKELRVYFISPLFYVVTGIFVFGWAFFTGVYIVANQQAQPAAPLFYASLMLVFVAPLVTMRLVAQEKQQGTMELLMTNPVRDSEVVVGKFLAAIVMLGILLAISFVAVLLLLWTAVDRTHVLGLNVGVVDWGAVLTGYLGNFLVFAGFAAIGILASSLTQNQIVAAVVGIVGLLVLWFGTGYAASAMTPPLSDVAQYINPQSHVTDFGRGVFSLPDLVYCLSLSGVPLFLASVVLSARKWH